MSGARSYESDSITVHYDLGRCIHAAECVKGLPSVFDPERRPWIDPGQAGAEEVAETIHRCPTGALTYERSDGGPAEVPAEQNSVHVVPDGPLYAAGRLRITLPDGSERTPTRAALCRCGHSSNKPFCDNAHREAGFGDAGVVVEPKLKDGTAEGEELHVTLATDGPVLVRGPVRVVGSDGTEAEGAGCAFCRCGRSSSKPFCDGTHRDAGFSAPGSG